jgi:lysophospholipase L1-like esterase
MLHARLNLKPMALFFAAVPLLHACAGSGGDPPSISAPAAASYLALGDSYTIGESVDSIRRWPVQLADALSREGVVTSEPRIIARTGWTTDELSAGIEAAGVEGRFELVSLLIGVNNQYRGRDPEEFRLQLRDLLRQAVEFSGGDPGRVLVLSIPDWGVMPFAEGRDRETIALEINTFNRIKREESHRAGARFVDITDISRKAKTNTGLVADDGLHPSGAMYGLWVERALPVAAAIMNAGG